MASKTIKGLTVEIGGDTTKLGKALEDVNKKSRNLSSELGQINKLLKMDPGNADLLAQKQKVLADAVSNTADKLEILEEAERQVQAQFERGEASEEQVRALQREVVEATQKLDKYKQAAKETADAVDALGDDAQDAAEEIDDAADSADKAERESEDLGSSLDGSLASGFAAVAAVAAAASAAIVGCVEASQEYRTAMGKLDTAFNTIGHTSEDATATYKELQSILGETDQAVEAASHLAILANDEEDLKVLTEALTGVYATFGASLPIEGLAEAANETVKVGAVTGSFADSLNWVAGENANWAHILEDNEDALKAFEEAVKDGEKTEDAYTAALEACSDEQERQELVVGTLSKIYSGAAETYKETNKRVIEANKANEEWNETMADLGNDLAPVVVEVKKFGTEMLKNAKEPLKEVASFLTDKVLPALSNLSKWVLNNIPTIKAGLAGVTAALVAYKVAVFAAEVSQKGLKGAILATEVAQKALNLAQAATPWGLAAVAIAGVVTALAVFTEETKYTAEAVDVLTEEEKELMAAADETAKAFDDQREAARKASDGVSSQMGHVQSLANELKGLADESGRVKEADQARADFILGELNEALGTEYSMTDGLISNYADMKKNIDLLIQSKTANALLEANNAEYVAALQAEDQAMQDLILHEREYQAQKDVSEQKIKGWEEELAELQEKQVQRVGSMTQSESMALQSQINNLNAKINEEKRLLGEKETAYNESAQNYGKYSDTIMRYEEAQTAALEGNYDETVEILKGKAGNYDTYADNVDQATRNTIDSLYKEAINAGLEAERTRRNFENGVKGYTKEMVTEAEKGYEAALNEWATAKTDAESVGKDLGSGLSGGMESKRSGLISKAKNIVSSIISAFREEADSHSPSRKMIDFGEDMGEGGEIGLENKTPDLLKTARKQVQGIMDTYRDESGYQGQNAARAMSERSFAQSNANMQNYINGNASKLDQILAAIKAGQILTIDGKTWVGATAESTDTALGQRRALVARGAL